MEEIKKELQEVILEQLKKCEQEKTAPSEATLNAIHAFITIENCL